MGGGGGGGGFPMGLFTTIVNLGLLVPMKAVYVETKRQCMGGCVLSSDFDGHVNTTSSKLSLTCYCNTSDRELNIERLQMLKIYLDNPRNYRLAWLTVEKYETVSSSIHRCFKTRSPSVRFPFRCVFLFVAPIRHRAFACKYRPTERSES